MKLSLLLLAIIIAIATPSASALDDLQKWNISGAWNYTYDEAAEEFEFSYSDIHDDIIVGNGESDNTGVDFYDSNCKAGGGMSYSSFFFGRSFERDAVDNSLVTLKFRFDKDRIVEFGEPLWVNEVPGRGRYLAFCVRMSLSTDNGADGIEISFHETEVFIGVMFDGSFTVDDIVVKESKRTSSEQAKVYQVSANLCNTAPGGDFRFKQGEMIQVCIQPAGTMIEDGVELTELNSFMWERTGLDSQVACCKPNEPPNTPYDGLTDISFNPLSTVVSTVLYATFFAENGEIKATGEVTLEYASRRLGGSEEGRKLEEELIAPSGFELGVELIKTKQGQKVEPPEDLIIIAGGSSPSLTMMGFVGLVISAVLLLT